MTWGLTFPLIKMSMKTQDPYLFVSLRFSFAALFVLPYYVRKINYSMFKTGLILGTIHLGAFLFQTIGLQSVDASRGAFLTSLYVLMIPAISPLFKMGKPGIHDLIAAIFCCFGVCALMNFDLGSMSIGDAWILLGAFFIAVSIIYIGKLSKHYEDLNMLAFGQIVLTALLSWVPTLTLSTLDFPPFMTAHSLFIMGICSLICTVVAILLQSKHQKFVSVQTSAIIFSLEPVFAAIFDSTINFSLPETTTCLGGILILLSVIYLEIFKNKEKVKYELS